MKPISNFGKWMALTAGLLGWLFDGLEMGLFPLVARPALNELLAKEYGGSVDAKELAQIVGVWYGIITALFLVGAATGGVLFGWLGDRFGRVRSMMLSVLTYALVSGLGGFANSAWQIGALRFVASLGMGGEWSLGVALINELWPDRSRAFLAGLMGAAGNVGYLMIALIGLGLTKFVEDVREFMVNAGAANETVEWLLGHGGWRFLMMLAALPALLTFFIRVFVPESARWEHERDKGTTSHWVSIDLIGVLVGALGAVLLIVVWVPDLASILRGISSSLGVYLDPQQMDAAMLATRVVGSCLGIYIAFRGYTWPVRKFLARSESDALPEVHRAKPTYRRMVLGACLSGVALMGTWGSVQQAPRYAGDLLKQTETKAWSVKTNSPVSAMPPETKRDIDAKAYEATSTAQIATAIGAIVATILAALLANAIGRRLSYMILCVGSILIIPVFYLLCQQVDATFYLMACLMGGITASFYGWLPLYLPEIFRTSVRATGQGFGFNFGRIIAAIGVLQMPSITALFSGDLPVAWACASLSGIYVVGMILIWFVPETKGQPLPE